MHSVSPHQIRILSCVGIAAITIASAVIGFVNLGKVPASDVPRQVISGQTDVTPADLSSTEPSDNTSSLSVPEEPPSPTEEKVKVKYVRITKSTNLRAKDDSTSSIVSVLTKDEEAELLSESGTRYKVKSKAGKTGWIIKSCGEIVEKEITLKHAPAYTGGAPIPLNGTSEGDGIAEILKKHAAVGASAAVIRDGQVAYHYEYGYANKEKKIKVSEDTKFRIASVTKVFTSMLAMTEVDDGKLDLDGDLSDIMGYTFRHPSYRDKKVTPRMLMTHTSGLIDRDGEFSMTLKSIVSNGNFYVSPPGVKFLYCNLNMAIAGAVVEKAADQTISQYAAEKFFTPMGIDASYDAKYLKDKSLVANCYSAGKLEKDIKYLCRSQERGKPGVTFHLGQGGLLISSVDLARVFTVLMNGGQYEGKQYLSPSALNEMLTPQDIATGKGFQQCIGIRKSTELVKKRDMYFHNGASYGIYSLMAFDPADKSGIIIITSGAFTDRNKNTVFAVCDEITNYSYENILK